MAVMVRCRARRVSSTTAALCYVALCVRYKRSEKKEVVRQGGSGRDIERRQAGGSVRAAYRMRAMNGGGGGAVAGDR